MMVLAATYQSHLGRLVDKNNLMRLLNRTIYFLGELGHISTTLHADAILLIHVRKCIEDKEQASSSFSSAPC